MSATFASAADKRAGRMSLAAHFVELRKRLVRIAAVVVVTSIGGWFLTDFVLEAMRAPIAEIARQQNRLAALNYDSLTSAFDLKIQIAITIGIVVSSPVWLYQLWAFFVPALTRKELKYGLAFFGSAVPLFLAGCAAGWLVVPHMVELLTSFAGEGTSTFLRATDYFNFILKLSVAVGVAFVLPVFVVLLNFVGVVSAKSIVKSWRIAVMTIVLFTAFATPSADVVSMFLLAVPMVLLYVAAAGIATIHDRRSARIAAKLASELST